MITNLQNRSYTNKIPPSLSFQAYKTAETRTLLKNLETKIDLYKLSRIDSPFLDEMKAAIKIKNLMPDLDEYGIERWQDMLDYAIIKAKEAENTTFLAVTENKPCGILTFNGGKNIFLDCICTFPIETGKKVKFAGKTLFDKIFKIFKENKAKEIKLAAITNGPFNNVKKYEDLGFVQEKVIDHEVIMKINDRNVSKTLEKFDKIIEYTPVKNSENIDLRDIIELP